MKGIPSEVKKEVKSIMSRYHEVQWAKLFGSRVRGDADERSDIDLVVSAPRISTSEWIELQEEINENVETLPSFDIVQWQKASDPLKKKIESEGELLYESIGNLGKALSRLKEALQGADKNTLEVDGTIQRFEFVIELFWKTFRHFLALEGIESTTPRDSLKKAYKVKWISDETAWLNMLRDRNMTSHLYDEAVAKEIFERIKIHYNEIEETYSRLKKKME